jgi:hypothetical protein
MVQRLARGPFKAEIRVRFPLALPIFGVVLKESLSVECVIIRAHATSECLQLLLSDNRRHVHRTPKRDALCLMFWSIIFEHHQGMLLLLRRTYYAPAFALRRPLEEAFARSFVAMSGTEKQVEALWAGTYKTEFEVVGNQVDQKIGCEPRFGPWFKAKVSMLRGFTHGGKEQLVRQVSGSDIVSSFTGEEICALVRETMPIAFLAALFTTEFLGYTAEYQKALGMFDAWVHAEASVQV